MPSTVAGLFAAANLRPEGVARWQAPLPERRPGVYAVALTSDPDDSGPVLAEAPVAPGSLDQLLRVRPELQLDGRRPGADQLAERLASFWLPDEVVLYIGRSGQPLRKRVRQYYRTPLGARRPHAGGWWLRTLSILDELWVHYAATADFVGSERAMLKAFANGVTAESRAALHDTERVAPYANLRTGSDAIKRHGISGATGDLPATREVS